MATVRPLSGLRFVNGDISALVAPPYDVISEVQRQDLASRSPHNMVHLTLPQSEDNDRSKFVKYAKSAALVQDWLGSGVLGAESVPTFYRYTQTFTTPTGESFTRVAVMSLIRVQPYEDGVVLPHEQTFPKHKEDRLRLLEATRSHLECIYGLYEDPGSAIHEAVKSMPTQPLASVTCDDGVEHVLEGIQDPAAVEHFTQLMADRKVWIADGHHRYETALAFRQSFPPSDSLIPEDFMLMALSSMEDPGLVLLPTHRILKRAPEDLLAKLEGGPWTMSPCPNTELIARMAAEEAAGRRAFGIALPGGDGRLLVIPDLNAVVSGQDGDSSAALRSLDVTILHDVIFAERLGLTGLDFFGYTRDPLEAIESVEKGAPASFLMNPPTVHDMRVIANGGEKMPQKSTYYYPKILSGLVMWRLADFS